MAIGYDPKHSTDAIGQIWRVGADIELSKSGEAMFRIIRTGSGQKSQGSEVREKELTGVRERFLSTYKVAPQRLLIFVALEMAYVQRFNTVKGLSTQGAMELSTLDRAKKALDYTASMTGAGFTAREGNWHEIRDLQERYYDILAGSGYEEALRPHEVRGFDVTLRTFNKMQSRDGRTVPMQLVKDGPHELEKSWQAYRKLHLQRKDRGNRN